MSTNLARPLGWEECQGMTEAGAEVEAALARVAGLDFTMLKQKLGQEKGWSPEQQEEVEDLYRRFLALNVAYPDRKICPTGPVDGCKSRKELVSEEHRLGAADAYEVAARASTAGFQNVEIFDSWREEPLHKSVSAFLLARRS